MDKREGELGNLCLGGFNTDVDHHNCGKEVNFDMSLREECELGNDVDLQGWGSIQRRLLDLQHLRSQPVGDEMPLVPTRT